MGLTFPAQSILLETPEFVGKLLSFSGGHSIGTRFEIFGIPLWVFIIAIGFVLVKPLAKKYPKFKVEEIENEQINSINSLYVVGVFVLLGLSFLEYATSEFARDYALFYAIALSMGVVLMSRLNTLLRKDGVGGLNTVIDNATFHVFPIAKKSIFSMAVLSIPVMLVLTGISNTVGKQATPFSTIGVSYQTMDVENKLMSAIVAPVEDLVMVRLIGFSVAFGLMVILSTLYMKFKSLKPAKTLTKNIIVLYNHSSLVMARIAVIAVVFAMLFNAEIVAPNFHEVNYERLAPQIAEQLGVSEDIALQMMMSSVADFWFWNTGVNAVTGSGVGGVVLHAFNNWQVS